MIKNYFFLSRLSYELKKKIQGCTIIDSFTQQKDKLEIVLFNEQKFILEFCVNHTIPFIQINEFFNRRKRNSKTIFSQIVNLKFSDVFIAKNDRVLLFQIENEISLFFTIRGKFTNIYLLAGDDFYSFKKIPDEDLEKIKNEFLSLEFIPPLTQPEFSQEDYALSFDELKRKYPFLSKEIFSEELKEKKISLELLLREINNIFYDDLYILNNLKNNELKIFTARSNSFTFERINKYNSAIETTKNFLILLDQNQRFINLFNLTSKHIDKELNYLKKKKENLQSRIRTGNNEAVYRKLGELLLINKSELKTGMNEITVQDIYSDNCPITIQLNTKLNPSQNIEYYFDKAKDEKLFFERINKILPEIERKITRLENAKNQLNTCESFNSLNSIMAEAGIKMKTKINKQKEPKIKLKQYVIENKYSVFVGRDNKSNDLLTLKFAKQNDFWFHARSVAGSHVVLRIDNKNDVVPKSILKKAASIAAFHSKAKNSSLIPVSYTFKKYVIKKKGMDVGQVALLKENTLLVKPEIPDDTILVEQDK